MRKFILIFIVGVAVITLAACATTTPYQPVDSNGNGYKSTQLENDRFRVSFQGNSRTDKETVRNYLLYRAAELTLSECADYFILTERSDEQDVDRSATVVGSPLFFSGFRFGTGFGAGTTVVNSSMREYEAAAIFVVRKGNKPADNPAAYDARQIKDNLKNMIRRPE